MENVRTRNKFNGMICDLLCVDHMEEDYMDNYLPVRMPYSIRQRVPSFSSFENEATADDPCEEESVFVDETHGPNVLKGLQKLQKEGQFCDVTLLVDGKEFPVHRNVLASFSPYFKAMFTTTLAEANQDTVTVNGIEGNTMELLLDYAYTGTLTINLNNVQSLLSAANLLQFNPVKEAACVFLEKHMNAGNCVGIHCFAESHSCLPLVEKAKEFVLKNFQEVYQGDEFLKLSRDKLIEFIKCDELEIENEEAVFKAVMKWFLHDPEGRKVDFNKVLENVRLPLMSPYFLHDCVENTPVIQNCAECRKLVEEAKTFHLLPDRRLQLQSQRTRQRASAAKLQVIVAVGGEDDKVVLRTVECYDPTTKIWRPLSCLPCAVSKHGLVVSGKNTLYLAGGEYPDGIASRSVFRYDPMLDSWQEMAPMLIPRSELGLAMLDGYVYAVGGWEGTFRLDSVEKYDATENSWRMIAPMKMAVSSPACVAHDGMLYVTGGAVLEEGDGIELVQRYDPLTDKWVKLAPMLIPRSGSAACVLDGYIYILGGWHASTENTRKVERYDVQNDKWEFVASMCERRYRPGVAVVGGKIFVLGGEEGWDRYHNSIECYNSDTDTWTLCGEMPSSRSWLACVPLQIKKSLLSNKDHSSHNSPIYPLSIRGSSHTILLS